MSMYRPDCGPVRGLHGLECLSLVGWLFTIVFTYLGFGCMVAGEPPAAGVDREVRRIIDDQYSIARRLIEDNKDKMHAMAQALLEWETIDAEQIDDIMSGKPPRAPKDWSPSSNKPSGPTPPVNSDGAPAAA